MNAVITGASRGLGRALSEKFASAGYQLFLTALRESPLQKVAASLQAKYSTQQIRAKGFDLSKKEGAKDCGRWILDHGLPIDILINNAGQFLAGSLYEQKDEVLEQMLHVNLYSAYFLTRTLLPRLMEQRKGHIFNICSIASLQAYPNGGAYSISKFALAGFSKNLREEMKPFGVKVTAVYPGAVYTDSWLGSGVDPQRIMEPMDVAEMIYAASQLSAQATTEDIVLRPQLGDL
jgi:short-subunit dehydrogenase